MNRIVVVVLMFVAALALSQVGCGLFSNSAENKSKQQSANNLKQLGIAMHNYHDAVGILPGPGVPPGRPFVPGFGPGITRHGWRVALLPYIEQDNLFKSINHQEPIPANISSTRVLTYKCPVPGISADTDTFYRVFVGKGAAFERDKATKLSDFTDGTANTILIVEAGDPVNWASTDELEFDPNKPLPKLGLLTTGFHALMADGSIYWIPAGADEKVIKAMITRNGGEAVDIPGTLVRF
jgi:hypothetical protein